MAVEMTDVSKMVLEIESYFFVKGSLPMESVSAVNMHEGASAK